MANLGTVLRDIVLVLAAAPLVYYLLATFAGWRFFRRARARKLPGYAPPVSVLKPLRGIDFGSAENFRSFCLQDYPDYEVLFAVSDASDAAIPLVENLQREFPQRRIRLVAGVENIGANRKVNKLARLAGEAQHEILVMSDGDVRVGPDYLREVVAPFSVPQVAMVTSFYRAVAQPNLGAQLEAIGAAGDFFPGVLMADWLEGASFALGASVATTKQWLQKIGGFAPIADILSDDYELGHRVAQAGGRIVLSREPVCTMYPSQTARGFLEHQLRWARTVRLCRPWSYAGLIFTQGLPWAFLAAVMAPARWMALGFLLAYLVFRTAMAGVVGIWGVQDDVLRRRWWLLPLRDALHFGIWLAGFVSNRITWAGEQFVVVRGRMIPAGAPHDSETGAPVASSRMRG